MFIPTELRNGDEAMIVHSLVKFTTSIHHKSQSKVVPVHNMMAHRATDVQLHSLLNSKLDDEW